MAKGSVVWVLLLVAPAWAGCLTVFDEEDDGASGVEPADVGYDASDIRVSGFDEHSLQIESFDGTMVPTVVYEPRTADSLPDGSPVIWPVVVFLHGWGFAKEQWQNFPFEPQGGQAPTDLLAEFAQAGFLAVAYDARGFGQSQASITVAGPAEIADLRAVIDHVQENFPASDHVGATGTSYGGGQSLLGLTQNGDIDAAAIHYGWTDLYDAVIPGNVPKLEWAEALYAIGIAGSAGVRSGTLLHEWYPKLYTRDDLEGLRSAMDVRSAADRLGSNEKPIFWCQGMQETLFPQFHRGVEASAGFSRAMVFTGGHSAVERACWDRTLEWFQFFLRGIDTDVEAWPALDTVDAAGDARVEFTEFPTTEARTYYLRSPNLGETASNATFSIQQRGLANPFSEPAFIWDSVGAPNNAVPEQFRQDPGGVFFQTNPVTSSQTFVGAAELRLHLDGEPGFPFQVVATLFKESGDRQLVLARGAFAAQSADDLPEGIVPVQLDWAKADLDPGDSLVLKLAANDPGMYMPLFADYQVTFTGHSKIDLPFFAP